jgi:transposase
MRSSRVLEKECSRNIEVMWLLKEKAPDHNTISNFRRDNEKAIRKVFQYTVRIAKMFDLIGGKLIAGDSTKLRAQNSKKNNYNPKKIERHLALAFNLRRLLNIIDKNEFKEYLEGLISIHFYIIYL